MEINLINLEKIVKRLRKQKTGTRDVFLRRIVKEEIWKAILDKVRWEWKINVDEIGWIIKKI